MNHKIIIVGAGVAGLSAGIFAQKNGYDVKIIERHQIPGGQCTGWDRKGYHIDGCIHWLVGTKVGTKLRDLWDITGALDGIEIYHPDSFLAVEHSGETIFFYRDLNQLKKSWIEISKSDEKQITQMCKDIEVMQTYEIPTDKPLDLMTLKEKMKLMVRFKDIGPIYQKYSKMSINQFANQFTHPLIQEGIRSFIPDMDFSAIAIIFALSTFTKGQSSIPMGGSKNLALRMKDKFISLGGEIIYNTEIKEAVISHKKITGLKTNKNEVITGDFYIFAHDIKHIFDQILNGQYQSKPYISRFKDQKRYPLASNLYVSLAYQGNMDHIPRTLRFEVSENSILQNNNPIKHLQMTHYSYEKTFAPEGHSVMTFAINQFLPELEYWQELSKNNLLYQKKKQEIGKFVLSETEKRFPEMKGKLILLDVATPKTYERYCNAYLGAFMGFMPTTKGKPLNHNGKIRGINNLLISGQWLQPPGGLPVALLTGKDTIMRLCKMDKKTFTL
jgi:phytoene dehydrogenase-like protein